MEKLGPSHFAWLEFDGDGQISGQSLNSFAALIAAPGVNQLLVMSHGWKNDKNDATALYGTLWRNTCAHLPNATAEAIAVAGVIWPAKVFRTDFDEATLQPAEARARVLSIAGSAEQTDLDDAVFAAELAAFEAFMGEGSAAVTRAAREASEGITTAAAARLVEEGARAAGIGEDPDQDLELAQDVGPIAEARKEQDQAQALVSSLSVPPDFSLDENVGAAQGLGEEIRGLFAGPRAAVARFLNQLTYFEMKKRAGTVGRGLARHALAKMAPGKPVRLHLVGHSFGARLVTAAADALTPPKDVELFSLTLLQGAFSHNALAEEADDGLPGAFRSVVGKPTGPVVITHTHNDIACTLAYALASRLSRDVTSAVGDAKDRFGAMGANGPQKLDKRDVHQRDAKLPFAPMPGMINPVLADAFIIKTSSSDAHNNVANMQCGRLLAATLQA